MKEEQYKQINMELIIHYKGSNLFDVITSTVDQYNPVLKTKITERLIISNGIISQMWNNLSVQELEIVKEMIANNNYTNYVSFMSMKVRDDKIDKLLNDNYNSIKNP